FSNGPNSCVCGSTVFEQGGGRSRKYIPTANKPIVPITKIASASSARQASPIREVQKNTTKESNPATTAVSVMKGRYPQALNVRFPPKADVRKCCPTGGHL